MKEIFVFVVNSKIIVDLEKMLVTARKPADFFLRGKILLKSFYCWKLMAIVKIWRQNSVFLFGLCQAFEFKSENDGLKSGYASLVDP